MSFYHDTLYSQDGVQKPKMETETQNQIRVLQEAVERLKRENDVLRVKIEKAVRKLEGKCKPK